MKNQKWDKWKYWEDDSIPHDNDPLIHRVLHQIEFDEEVEQVYDLLDCIPRERLVAYVLSFHDLNDKEVLQELIDEEVLTHEDLTKAGITTLEDLDEEEEE
jgi:hypothetical protein